MLLISIAFVAGYLLHKLLVSIFYDIVEPPKNEETGVAKKIAYIEKIEEGKFFLYDKETHQYLCQFTSWTQVSNRLGEIDNKVDWIIEHCYPEIDRKTLGE